MAKFQVKQRGFAKLRKAAAARGKPLTDVELAEAIGVHRTTVSRVLNGEMPPGIPFLAGIVSVFGWEWLAELFDTIDDEPRQAAS